MSKLKTTTGLFGPTEYWLRLSNIAAFTGAVFVRALRQGAFWTRLRVKSAMLLWAGHAMGYGLCYAATRAILGDLCKCAYLLSSCNLGSKTSKHGYCHGTGEEPTNTSRLWALKMLSGPAFPHSHMMRSTHLFNMCFLFAPAFQLSYYIILYIYFNLFIPQTLLESYESVISSSCLGYPCHESDTVTVHENPNLLHEKPESVTWKTWICYMVPVGYVWPQHKVGFKEAMSGYNIILIQ